MIRMLFKTGLRRLTSHPASNIHQTSYNSRRSLLRCCQKGNHWISVFFERTSVVTAAVFSRVATKRTIFGMWLLNAEVHQEKSYFLDETGFKIETGRRMGRSLVGKIAQIFRWTM
jgi:hypothetical protein